MRPGLALTSIALGAVGLVFAVSAWVTWAIVHPGALPHSFAIVVMVGLGALWVVGFAVAVLTVIFGIAARQVGRLARLGIGVGVLDLVLALAGVLTLVLSAPEWRA